MITNEGSEISELSKKVINHVDTAGKWEQHQVSRRGTVQKYHLRIAVSSKTFVVFPHVGVVYIRRLETRETVEIMREEDPCF